MPDAPAAVPAPAKVYYFVPVARAPHANFVASFERARAEAQTLGVAHFTLPEWNMYSVDIANKRNVGASKFLASDMEWLMMVDDDMDFRHDPAAIAKMIVAAEDEKCDIVAPLMVRRDPPHWVCFNEVRMKPDDTLDALRNHQKEAVIECTGHVGTGCILIRRRVIEDLPPPWFVTVPRFSCRECQQTSDKDEPRKECARCKGTGRDPEGVWFEQGEDTYFCRRAHDAGFKVACATGVIVGHLGESSLTIHDSVRVGYPIIYAQNILKRMEAKMREFEERGIPLPAEFAKMRDALTRGEDKKPEPTLVIAR